MALKVGTRVVRGPDWKWKDQDDGEGNVGTVIKIGKGLSNPDHPKLVMVLWDRGTAADYRAGFDDQYDLLVFDSAPTGIKHDGVICNECQQENIAGMRWKCGSCPNFNLCSVCYMGGTHDLKHTFIRICIPNSEGESMTPRSRCTPTEALGLFAGAKVCRGRDWQWREQDAEANAGRVGRVVHQTSWHGIPRSAVTVRWDGNKQYQYRAGHEGKVDVKCVRAGTGGSYYKDHLPRFGEIGALEVGDRVIVKLDKEVLKLLQKDHGGWNYHMEEYIGQVGKISRIHSTGDIRIKYPDGQSWTYNFAAVTKLPTFTPGDKVRILSDIDRVKELQKGHGGWAGPMSKTIGEEARVMFTDTDGDIKVKVKGEYWTYNPDCLIPHDQERETERFHVQDREELLQLLRRLIDEEEGVLDHGDVADWLKVAAAAKKEEGGSKRKELIRAAYKGDVTTLKSIIAKEKDMVNIKVQGMTALHIASYKGHLPVVQLLVDAEAKLDEKDRDGDTAISNAVNQGHERVAKYLLQKKVDPNTANFSGKSPLHIAVNKKHLECVKLLLLNGCDTNLQDERGDTALHDAIRRGQNTVVGYLVNAANVDLKIRNKKGFNPLQHAALHGNASAASIILKKDRSLVNEKKSDGYAALHLAVTNNHPRLVQILIREGDCAVDLYNEEHQTPLALAISKGHTAIIEELISHQADVNASDSNGDTCLHIAVMKHREGGEIPDSENLRKFRQKYQDNGITTPLAALLCYLVQEGASVTRTNLKKHSAFYCLQEAAIQRVLEHIARKKERQETGDSSFVKPVKISTEEKNDNDRLGMDSRVLEEMSPSDDTQKSKEDSQISACATPPDDSFTGVHIIREPDKELHYGPVIGRGGFGEVSKGQWRGTSVAIKTVCTMGSGEEEVNHEVAIHKRALHPNIVRLMAVGHEIGQVVLVMQLINGKNLMDIIFSEGNSLSFESKLNVCRGVLSAVTFLHHSKILHLDIKPQNVILESGTHKPYLCDLGLSHIKARCAMSVTSRIGQRGTRRYMPPESINCDDCGKMKATAGTDIWSLACTFLELFTSDYVWPLSMDEIALVRKFIEEDVTPPNVEKLDEPIRGILEPCFKKNSSQRPTADSMRQQFSRLKP